MKRLLLTTLTVATVMLFLFPGRAQAQSAEIKQCTTQYRMYAIAGAPHISVAGTTPINWLPLLMLLGISTEVDCA